MVEDVSPKPEQPREYLGDGVHASFDGYHVVLARNHHDNEVIWLEPDVLRQLVAYARRIGMNV